MKKRERDEQKEKKISLREQAFIEFYLQSWNASDAARRAGYSERSARELGRRLLTKVDVRAEIDARLREIQMGTDEVHARLTEQARGSIEDFGEVVEFDEEAGGGSTFRLDLAAAHKAGKLGNVKKLKATKYGWELELHDAQAALVHVGKIHGMFVDRKEITGRDGGDIVVKQFKGETSARDLLLAEEEDDGDGTDAGS